MLRKLTKLLQIRTSRILRFTYRGEDAVAYHARRKKRWPERPETMMTMALAVHHDDDDETETSNT